MKNLIILAMLCLASLWQPARGQVLNTYNNWSELIEPIGADDWVPMWKTSTGRNMKISPVNLLASRQPLNSGLTSIAALTNPGATRLLFWNASVPGYRYLTLGTGLSITGETLNGGSGSLSGPVSSSVGNLVEWNATNGSLVADTGIAKTDIPLKSAANTFTGGRQSVVTTNTPGFVASQTGGRAAAMVAGSGAGVFTFDEAGAFGISSAPNATVVSAPGSGGNYRVWVDGTTGNVGVGNTAPTVRLDVTGTVKATTFVGDGSGLTGIAGTGDVSAAAAFAADNRLLRSDGTAKGAQASVVTVDDTGNMSGVGTIDATAVTAATLTWEGATPDDFETSLGVVDPTADRFPVLPDRTGTVALDDSTSAQALLATLAGGTTQGSIAVRGLSGWTTLAPDTPGHVLTTNGAGANASWAAPSGGGAAVNIASSRQNVFIWDEFIGVSGSATFGPLGLLREVTGGAVASGLPTSSPPASGVMNLYTSTGTTNKVGVMSNASNFSILFGGGTYVWETRVNIETLPVTTTNEYVFRAGFLDAISVQPTDGCYFQFDAANANWFTVSRAAATETATASSVAVAANTWTKLRIEVNAAATSVAYYIDGTLVKTDTTNIPSGSNIRGTSIGAGVIKATGSVDNDFFFDYMGLEIGLTTSR